MTDLHTHILPGLDDGAQTVKESVAMLHTLVQQGVDTVALTPHYYGRQESIPDFLDRREQAYRQLLEAVDSTHCPELILGAEVAWMPDMLEWPELEMLCYQNTRTLMVELPFMPWTDDVFRHLYSLEGRRGITPMIAHLDRYFRFQPERNIVRLLETGYPIQISAEALFRITARRRALELLEVFDGILISDCHNMRERRPKIGEAMQVVAKKLGNRSAVRIAEVTEDILAD